MSAFIWCEIVCMDCAETVAGRFIGGRLPRAQMTAEAKQYGWKLARSDLHGEKDWLCPTCSRKRLQKQVGDFA